MMDDERRQYTSNEIVELLMDVSKHIKKCCDFKIKYWLNRYEEMTINPNFAEAALLIINAACIYGHKVDYLEAMILNMDRATKSMDADNKNGEIELPNKKRKKQHLTTKTDRISNIEYNPKTYTKKPIDALCENLQMNGIGETSKPEQCPTTSTTTTNEYSQFVANISRKYMDNPPFFRHLNRIQANNSCPLTFGGHHILDNDFSDIDSRWNYRIYVDSIVQEANVICRIADYERSLSDKLSRNNVDDGSVKPFHLYLPSDELKSIYDLTFTDSMDCDYNNMQKYERLMERVLCLNEDELCQMDNGKNINNIIATGMDKSKHKYCDSGVQETCLTDKDDQPADEDDDHNNNNGMGQTYIRKSFDEGIAVSGFTSPSCVSDLDPVVELYDIFNPINDAIDVAHFEYNLSKSNKLNILKIPLDSIDTITDFTIFTKSTNAAKRKMLLDTTQLQNIKMKKLNLDLSKISLNLEPLSDHEFSDDEFSGFTDMDLIASSTLCNSFASCERTEQAQNSTIMNSSNSMENTHVEKCISSYTDSGFCDEDENLDSMENSSQRPDISSLIVDRLTEAPIDNETGEVQLNETSVYETVQQTELQFEHLKMAERVKRWHVALKPVLGHSKHRHIFSINEIKSNIANFCLHYSDGLTFQQIVDHHEHQYTSRYFLGLLELANRGIVVIDHPPSTKVCSHDKIKIFHNNYSTSFKQNVNQSV